MIGVFRPPPRPRTRRLVVFSFVPVAPGRLAVSTAATGVLGAATAAARLGAVTSASGSTTGTGV